MWALDRVRLLGQHIIDVYDDPKQEQELVITQFGFGWGPILFTRAAFVKRDRKRWHYVVRLETPRTKVDIYVTRTGIVTLYVNGNKMEVK